MEVLSGSAGGKLDHGTLSTAMPYTEAVIYENLRIHSPVIR